MTIERDGLELFSMAEAVAEITEHTGEHWEELDLLKSAATRRIQVLCHATDVPVNDHRHGYKVFAGEGEDDFFEEITVHINPTPKKHTGFFYPFTSEGGESYLKAISQGKEAAHGITTLESGTMNDFERCFDSDGYRPSIDKFYVNSVHLLMLIENILLRNENQYVALFIAAEAMALEEGGRKAQQLKQRFGWIRGEKHLDRLTNAGEQGQFPIWQARTNGDWYSEWGESVYSTSLVLVEDINKVFNTELELGNQSLTREALDQAIKCWETLELDSSFKFYPRAQQRTKQIYRYIVEQLDSNYDFSKFSMIDVNERYGVSTAQLMEGIGVSGGEAIDPTANFKRNYLQPASKVLRAAANKYKNNSKK